MLTSVSPFLADTKALTMSNITQMKITYPESLFTNISVHALDFIKSLIKRIPRYICFFSIACIRVIYVSQLVIISVRCA